MIKCLIILCLTTAALLGGFLVLQKFESITITISCVKKEPT